MCVHIPRRSETHPDYEIYKNKNKIITFIKHSYAYLGSELNTLLCLVNNIILTVEMPNGRDKFYYRNEKQLCIKCLNLAGLWVLLINQNVALQMEWTVLGLNIFISKTNIRYGVRYNI